MNKIVCSRKRSASPKSRPLLLRNVAVSVLVVVAVIGCGGGGGGYYEPDPPPTEVVFIRVDKATALDGDSVTISWKVVGPGQRQGSDYCYLALRYQHQEVEGLGEVECEDNRSLTLAFPEGSGYVRFSVETTDRSDSSAVVLDFVTVNLDTFTSPSWQTTFGTPGHDGVRSTTIDLDGNVIVVGATDGNLSRPTFGLSDAFVRKYSIDGTLLWEDQFGTSSHDEALAVGVDGYGNIFVGGRVDGPLGGTHYGYNDAFLRKYDAAGQVLWSRQFGTTENDAVTDLAVFANGDVVVVGTTFGPLVEPGLEASGFVRFYSYDGTEGWTVELRDDVPNDAFSVAIDRQNNIYVGGTYSSLDYENERSNAYLTQLDYWGNVWWSAFFGAAGYDTLSDVVIGSDDTLYVAVESSEWNYVGATWATVHSVTTSGFVNWSTNIYTDSSAQLMALPRLAFAADGELLFSATRNESRFDEPSYPFIGALNATGEIMWTRELGLAGWETLPSDIAAASDGGIVVVGSTDMGFEGEVLNYIDAFIIRLGD